MSDVVREVNFALNVISDVSIEVMSCDYYVKCGLQKFMMYL